MSALTNKELALFLEENAISDLYITGLLAEACIKGTTMAAIRNHYHAVLVEDAVGSKYTKKKLASLLYCERKGAKIISSYQLQDNTSSKNEATHTLIPNMDKS